MKVLVTQSCLTVCNPWTVAHQAPLSMEFSRQEHGVGCHFLLQCMKVKSESEVAQSCPTLCDPMDCSLPVCSIHGTFQARVLEWGAIALSLSVSAAAAAAKSLWSCLTLCDPTDGSPPCSPDRGILQARTWSGLPFPSPMHASEKGK